MPRKLRILTWHIHGNYLWYLSQSRHEFYLPVKAGIQPGYGGRGTTFPFGDNVIDVPHDEVCDRSFDCILFQARPNFEQDQYEILSPAQRRLPRIYLEHDPPQEHPTNTRHWVDDPNVLLVHVTAFNRLMWDNGRTPTRVIEHGVLVPEDVRYTGDVARGVVVINHLAQRGRRLGSDVFVEAARQVPLDLVGMASEDLGGLGEVPPPELAKFVARYRFFFNPIRYTSLGLAVCEAMTIGLPIVALATTENVTVIKSGVSGWLDTDLDKLAPHMHRLIRDPAEARSLGSKAREEALVRFDIRRFVADWERTFAEVTSTRRQRPNSAAAAPELEESYA
jgi:glycosyltransferase involved in cell wall biosynthesis